MEDKDLGKLAIGKAEKQRRVRRRPKIPLSVLLAFLAAFVMLTALWAFLSKATYVEAATVAEVYPAQLLSRLSASGYVVAQRRADVATRITAQLVEILVEEGSVVKEGQLLARLENDDAVARVRQARANERLAEARVREAQATLDNLARDYERMQGLVKTGAVSRSEFDTAKASYLTAQASLAAARAAARAGRANLESTEVELSYTEIRAPFDAVVLTKNADVGDIVTALGASADAKAAVVSIADLSSLMVEADVSESNLSMVRVGQPCDITLDALPGLHFPGVADTIVPTVDRSKATVLVKVRFLRKDTRILPEMSAKVGFLSRPLEPGEQRPRTMVASSAIVRSDEGTFVYLIREGKAVRKEVRTGEKTAGMTAVLDGVQPGDVVVSNPPEGLRSGSKVKVVEK